jgi:hypothetical protein
VDESEDFPIAPKLEGDLANADIDGEAREQKTLSGKRNVVKNKKTSRYERKRYQHWYNADFLLF